MSDTTRMPLLSFGYGLEANLPNTYTQGKIYITTDKHRMYVDLPGTNDRLCLNNFELVDGNLPSTGIAGQFYVKKVTTGSGDTATTTYSLHCYDGNNWKEIINVVDLENSITSLEGRMGEVEGRLDAYDSDWTELSNTYLKLDGSNSPMTGDLNMGSKKITNLASGGTTATNAANIGDVNSAIGTHAEVTGSNTALGHVKLSDATADKISNVTKGIAATPKAVADAYDLASSAKSAAEAAQSVADAAMPKAGGTFAGDVSFAEGKYLTVNAPRTTDAGKKDVATREYVDAAKSAAITAVQGVSSDTKDSATVAGAKKYTDDKISNVTSAIEGLQGSIGNLSNIMNFLGTTTTEIADGTTTTITKPSAVTDTTYTAKTGDVVVDSKGKECVFDGTVWRVIGDTSANSTAITNLQNTIGTKPASMGTTTLWAEVDSLRSDLGEQSDDATTTAGTGTAFARIAALEAENATQNSAIVGLGTQLTWTSF